MGTMMDFQEHLSRYPKYIHIKKPLRLHPEDYPAAGFPSTKPEKNGPFSNYPAGVLSENYERERLHPEDFPAAGLPSSRSYQNEPFPVHPREILTMMHYNCILGKVLQEDYPAAGLASRSDEEDHIHDHQQEDASRYNKKIHLQPERLHPEDYPAAGLSSRSDEEDHIYEHQQEGKHLKPEQPHPEDYPAAGLASSSDEEDHIYEHQQEDTRRYNKKIHLKPLRLHPEDYPAAGLPSPKPEKNGPFSNYYPKYVLSKNYEKERLHPEDFPAAGLPSSRSYKNEPFPVHPREILTMMHYNYILGKVLQDYPAAGLASRYDEEDHIYEHRQEDSRKRLKPEPLHPFRDF